MTFTLTGFATVKREGFELPGDFVATLNADLKVGGVEETMTVSGESPIVDVQSTKKQQDLDLDLIQYIPAARGYASVMLLIPSMVVSGGAPTNVQLSAGMIVFGGRGGRGNEGQSQIDGLGTGAAINGGGVSGYGQLETAQEVVMTASGGLGESEIGGPYVNFIPKTGGNTFANHFYGSGMKGWMQANNRTQQLISEGMTTPQHTLSLADVSLSDGGPIVKDRLWFFYNTRYTQSTNTLPGIYYNLNAGNPNAWLYAPDLSRSVAEYQRRRRDQPDAAPHGPGHAERQVEPVPGSEQLPVQRSRPDRRDHRPDRGSARDGHRLRRDRLETRRPTRRMETIRWTRTATTKLLLEAGLSAYQQNWNGREVPGNNDSLIPVTEQCSAGCPNNGNIQGLTYRAQTWSPDFMEPIRWNASATYVTGAHNMKAGYIGAFYWNESNPNGNNQDLTYTFNNGVPNGLTENMSSHPRGYPRQDERGVCAGPVDGREADHPGGAAVRPFLELLSAAAAWPGAVLPDTTGLPADAGGHRVQQHRPAHWRGV